MTHQAVLANGPPCHYLSTEWQISKSSVSLSLEWRYGRLLKVIRWFIRV
jgi:hypothetical protein